MSFRTLFGLIFLFVFAPAHSYAADVPQSFTLDGKLFSDTAGTTALQDASVTFTVQILDEAKTCVIYEESQSISTASSKGYFSVQVGTDVGSPLRTSGDSANSMATVFQNISSINGKLLSNGTACTVTATGGKRRYARIKIAPSTMGGATRLLSPDLSLDSVPNAVVAERAESLQGLRATNVLQVNTTGTNQLSQTNLESLFTSTARFNSLTAVVDGTSSSYMRSNSASGAQLPTMAGAPTSPTPGSIWYDTADSKLKYQTSVGPIVVGDGSGTVTSVGFTAPSELSVAGAPLTTSGTIAVSWATQTANKVFAAPDGVTGTPAFRVMVANDIPNLPWTKITSLLPTTLLGYGITDAVKNNGGTPSFESGLNAAKGAATTAGRIWISTDTKEIYRDTGATWDLIGATSLGYTPVNKAGDTMTGLLVLSADPAANLGAATKQYVDSTTATAATNAQTYADTKFITKNLPAAPAVGQNGQSIRWNNAGNVWEYYTPSTGAGTGDVSGPGSSTDNAIARFDGTTGKLVQNSGVVIDDSGNVGIGTTSPTRKLDVMGDSGIVAKDISGSTALSAVLDIDPTVDDGRDLKAITGNAYFDNYTPVVGTYNGNALTGVYGRSWSAMNGTMGKLTGVEGHAKNSGAGTATDAYGVKGSVDSWRATGTNVTNAYGGHFSTSSSGPSALSIVNGYGVYISTIGGATNKFSLYSSDSTAPSYFAGNVGIGTTTPGSRLEVTSSPTATTGTIAGQQVNYTWAPSAAAGGATGVGDLTTVSSTSNRALGTLAGEQVNVTYSPTSTGGTTWLQGSSVSLTASGAGSGGPTFMIGQQSDVTYSMGGLSQAKAFKGSANLNSAGTLGTAYGLDALITTSTSGSAVISNAYGVSSQISSSSGSITTAYGIYSDLSQSGGAIQTGYGVYIGNVQATNKWSLYANDAAAPSYFAGSVGIGTTSPSTTLDINGAQTFRGVAAASAPPTAGQGKIYFDSTANKFRISENNGAYVDLVGGGSGSVSGTSGRIAKFTSGTAVGDSVITESSGNIGVGALAATPLSNFHVDSGSTMYSAIKTGSAFIVTSGGINGTQGRMGVLSGTAFGIQASDYNSSSPNNLILNPYGGNVGIGTTNPSSALDVNMGAINAHGYYANAPGWNDFFFTGKAAGQTALELITSGRTGGIQLYNTAGALSTRIIGEGDSYLNSGNVGIGVTGPTSKLQVAGDITPDTTATKNLGSGSLRWNNIYLSNAPDVSSDARLKKDVQTSDLGLDFINSLRPVSWTWKDQSQGTTQHYGVIAQEAESAIAKAKGHDSSNVIVTHNEETDSYSVRYTELISPLIKAIQELYNDLLSVKAVNDTQDREIASVKAEKADKAEVDQLKAENVKLKADAEKQKQENAAIKAYLCAKDPKAAICN